MPTDTDAIAWDDRFSIGEPDIDGQHQRLFGIYNEIAVSLTLGSVDARRCEITLRELGDYARYHFLTEETLMRELGFPRLAEHAREHREFSGVLQILTDRVRQEGDVIPDVARFVRQWILNHVILSDGLIRQYARG